MRLLRQRKLTRIRERHITYESHPSVATLAASIEPVCSPKADAFILAGVDVETLALIEESLVGDHRVMRLSAKRRFVRPKDRSVIRVETQKRAQHINAHL